jgi:hypothetical protein
VTRVERETPGLRVLAALIREPHGRTVAQLEKRDDPPEPAPDATFAERMGRRTATAAGRALYKLRQQTVEPVFGIIKEAMGFRRFSLRGLKKVSLEWDLVCLAYNVKRLHRLGAAPGGNRSGPVRTKPIVPRLREQLTVSESDQNGSGRVFAGLKPVKIRFSALWVRLKLSLTPRRTQFLLPGIFLSPKGC